MANTVGYFYSTVPNMLKLPRAKNGFRLVRPSFWEDYVAAPRSRAGASSKRYVTE
jgi:hypothetical protein